MPVRMHWGVVGVSCFSGPLLLGHASCGDGHRALREVMLTCRVGNPSFIYSVEAFQMSSCMRGHIAIAHRVIAKTGSSMAEGSSPLFGVIHPLLLPSTDLQPGLHCVCGEGRRPPCACSVTYPSLVAAAPFSPPSPDGQRSAQGTAARGW